MSAHHLAVAALCCNHLLNRSVQVAGSVQSGSAEANSTPNSANYPTPHESVYFAAFQTSDYLDVPTTFSAHLDLTFVEFC